ncbi:[Protein-PII] uridylyltransferase [invertebrate metagenome]|uniref:[Protein-PII] uridylyltransferase n=1 Tax=invertebrate metagenome TaxID=1711999 RepID=A0A484H5Z6_9ZZZZ
MSEPIPGQREIIDRKAINVRLDAIAHTQPRKKQWIMVLALLKEMVYNGRVVVRHRFEEDGASGTDVVRANSFLMDQLIRIIHDFTDTHMLPPRVQTIGDHLGLAAVGGYGRRELSPCSDLDLLFLLSYKTTPYCEQMVECILYMLWDLGLKVGHATRTVDECIQQAKADTTVRTAMLEARWLWGAQDLYNQFRLRFQDEIVKVSAIEFVETKLAERDARHERLGDARYVLEPNVKEGKGGLRDLHTLFWIVRYLYGVSDMGQLVKRGVLIPSVAARFAKAQNFLWTVRCHLHYLTGRAEDRLTFDVQQSIGHRMGYTDHAGTRGVERFMKHYFLIAKDVGNLTRILCAVLEERHKRKPKLSFPALTCQRRAVEGFALEGGRLTITPEIVVHEPVRLIQLFHVAHKHDIDIHPNALRLITENLTAIVKLRDDPAANGLFLDILTARKNPVATLRLMNESSLFGRFIPDFGRVVAQMQYDMYHVYTTDEHTIRAIGVLHDIEAGELAAELPLSTQLIQQVHSRRALYMAVLLHDLAKGRGGDHSELGTRVAWKLCTRFRLTAEESDTTSWLVLHHLHMSRTAFKRDLDDAKTVEDFVKVVQSPERLRLLLLLTCCDIRAVGPMAWNGWKGALLRELYYRAAEAIAGASSIPSRDSRVAKAMDALRMALSDWPLAAVQAHLARGYPAYWLGFQTEAHVRHAHLIRAAEASGRLLTFEYRRDPSRAGTELVIYTSDHPGLFSQMAGAIALTGESVVDARVITLANGMALDTFWIQEPHSTDEDEQIIRLQQIATTIEKVLKGYVQPELEFRRRKNRKGLFNRIQVFKVPPRCIIDNTASKTHTVVEINGRDRPGFLFNVTSTLTGLGLRISSAQIATYGERVVDVFYVKDIFGMKITHGAKVHQVRRRVLEVLGDLNAPLEPLWPLSPRARNRNVRAAGRKAAMEE